MNRFLSKTSNLALAALLLGFTLASGARAQEPAVNPAPQAAKGGQDAGAGSAYEQEFKDIAEYIYWTLKNAGVTDEQVGFPLERLATAIDEVMPFGTDAEEIPLNKQAVNSKASKVIVFGNAVWSILNDGQKMRLVAHEYMRFVGVDDRKHAFSLNIIQIMKRLGQFPIDAPAPQPPAMAPAPVTQLPPPAVIQPIVPSVVQAPVVVAPVQVAPVVVNPTVVEPVVVDYDPSLPDCVIVGTHWLEINGRNVEDFWVGGVQRLMVAAKQYQHNHVCGKIVIKKD